MRGIRDNRTIVVFALIALCLYFSYSLMADRFFRSSFDAKIYNIQVKTDTVFLRGKKLVVLNTEDCPVYKTTSFDSKIKGTLPIWTAVELRERKVVNGEVWSKIKKITDTKVITGWVPMSCTVPYNTIDYNNFDEIAISSAEASSYLTGDSGAYLPNFAYDWNRETSWQDGYSEYEGKGESITLNFAETTTVNVIQIFPGNAKNEQLYYDNERIKEAKIKFSDGSSVKYEFDDLFYEPYQTIWLNKPVEADSVTIEILDTYEGNLYKDLCISEVHVYKNKTTEQ